MSIWDAVVAGGQGFLMGGPWGAGLGLAGSLLSQHHASSARAAATTQASLSQQQQDNAYMRGYMQTMAGGGGAGGGLVGTAGVPTSTLSTRQAQQAGGHAYPTTSLDAQSQLEGSYQGYLQAGLSGQGAQTGYNQQLSQGLNVINAQAASGEQGLLESLGRRGLLRSGVTSRGLADVERGRLGAVGGLAAQLAREQAQAQQESQYRAASLYAGGTQSAAQLEEQRRARLAAEPSTADYLAGLASAYMQYRYRPQDSGYAALMGQYPGALSAA